MSAAAPARPTAPGARRSRGMSARTETTLRIVAPIAVGLIVLGAWQFLVTVVGVSDYLLPSPASIICSSTHRTGSLCARPLPGRFAGPCGGGW